MSFTSYKRGQRVELNDGRQATIRFVGSTSFQTGDWIGVELEAATGKNDGSVKGERYFQCEPNYGMFLRPAGIRQVVEDVPATQPRAAKAVGNGVAAKSRASVVPAAGAAKRQSVIGPSGARAGMPATGSPSPAPRLGVRSPTKATGSNGGSSTATSRTSTPPVMKRPGTNSIAARGRLSLAPPGSTPGRKGPLLRSTQRATRSSLAPSSTALRTTAIRNGLTGPSSRFPPAVVQQSGAENDSADDAGGEDGEQQEDCVTPKKSERSSEASRSETNGEELSEDSTIRPRFAPPSVPPDPPQASPTSSRPRRPSSPAAASVHSQRTIRSTMASTRQIEELEAKVRLLERRRTEDRDVKKNLEQAKQERDQYKGIIEKLQTKYRPQQQELTELKKALDEAEKKVSNLEAIQAEHDSVVEMATLDREMAEETAEGLKAELEALRAHNEEVQLELDILREENVELSKEMSPEERESAGWVQLQHSNDRLRDALLKLRDRSLDEKEELKEQISGLEEQVKGFDSLRTSHEETKEKLLRSEAGTEDLRQQLEVSMQAEEMIEELTERNGRLETTLDEMRIAIEDLENLKELNDELEINHVEAEKQMQEEIDFKNSLLVDRERTARLQQEALDSKDDTIRQFRRLVGELQADMVDMQASKQLSETEAKDLEDKSRAMLDLNLKLQSSAAKTQVKAIDLELRKLEAQEAGQHLEIVQLFLPEAFDAERDSVLALLRFRRIAFKADLLHGFLRDRVASFGTRGMEEDVFAACDALEKSAWIAAMAERFVKAACSCSPDEFGRFESALHELEPVERALNGYIDALRRDEIKERIMAEELQRSIAVMSHLASIHLNNDLASHADDLLMRTLVLQSQLESVTTALQLSRTIIEAQVQPSTDGTDEESDGDDSTAAEVSLILGRADTLITHARSAKVTVNKAHRALTDLQARSLTLEMEHMNIFENAESISREVVTYTRQAGGALHSRLTDETSDEAPTPSQVSGILSQVALEIFSLDAPEAGPFNALARRVNALTEVLTDLAALPNDLDNTIEFERGSEPWISRANELKQIKLTSIDTEAELSQTLTALRDKDTTIREKETELEEQSIRIEMLEARMKDASKRSARIGELEKTLHEVREAERKARQENQRIREEKDRELERTREEMNRLGEAKREAGKGGDLDSDAMGAMAKLTMKRLEFKILALEGAIRHLKEENTNLRLPPADSPLSARKTLRWLHEPLFTPKTARQKRNDAAYEEGRDVLNRLLALTSSPKDQALRVDLTTLPENKLAWRPVKQSSRWKVEKGKEEWESWKDWRRDVVRAASAAGR